MAQRALIEIVDTVPIVTTAVPPLEAFLESLKVAGCSAGEVRPTAKPKPSKPRYRTVPDSLETVTDMLKAWFRADPSVTGRQLLERLQADHPGEYTDYLVRTVQRRLKLWRRESARALFLGDIDTVSANGGLSDDALRWLRAPRPAGKPPAPDSAQTEAVAVATQER